MEYVHVKNLEKYHPGYKDRTLQWAKIYINMASGDPDTELIEDETDWSRFVKIILLELRAQKPLPNLDIYWERKGFNLKKRPMSLTLKMLHNFLEVVTNPLRREDKDKEEDKDKNVPAELLISEKEFEEIWQKYPVRDGRKAALKHFLASVFTQQDLLDIHTALQNYLKSEKVQKGFIKNGSTWFNNWRDWIALKEPQPYDNVK